MSLGRDIDRVAERVRLSGAKHTTLQSQQEKALPELSLEQLPLPLGERMRYVAGSVLLYSWWYGLHAGVLPDDVVEQWVEGD